MREAVPDFRPLGQATLFRDDSSASKVLETLRECQLSDAGRAVLTTDIMRNASSYGSVLLNSCRNGS